MLSPKLLETLRSYWRAVRPTGEWLFKGDIAGHPITASSVEVACQQARRLRNEYRDLADARASNRGVLGEGL